MKSSDYSNLKTLKELRRMRFENDVRLDHSQNILHRDFYFLRESLKLNNIVSNTFDNTLSMMSQVDIFRRGYFWIRSFFHDVVSDNLENDSDTLKKDSKISESATNVNIKHSVVNESNKV